MQGIVVEYAEVVQGDAIQFCDEMIAGGKAVARGELTENAADGFEDEGGPFLDQIVQECAGAGLEHDVEVELEKEAIRFQLLEKGFDQLQQAFPGGTICPRGAIDLHNQFRSLGKDLSEEVVLGFEVVKNEPL